MAWFREVYCEEGTAESLCMVPVYGEGNAQNETEWCQRNYNATNCTEIRDAAQAEVAGLMSWFYNANLAWGCALIAVVSVLCSNRNYSCAHLTCSLLMFASFSYISSSTP